MALLLPRALASAREANAAVSPRSSRKLPNSGVLCGSGSRTRGLSRREHLQSTCQLHSGSSSRAHHHHRLSRPTPDKLTRPHSTKSPCPRRPMTVRHPPRCSAAGQGETPQKLPRMSFPQMPSFGGESLGDRITAYLVNGGGSGAIGSYMAEPVTWLHNLDPRVKQIWLFMLVALPARSGLALRCILCGLLLLVTILSLPRKTSARQLLQATLLSLLLLVSFALGSDGIRTTVQARDVPPSLEPLLPLPAQPQLNPGPLSSLFGGGYKFVLFKWGPFQMTRRGFNVGAKAATLSFIILQSAALSLTTTTPEATTSALRWLMLPFRRLGAPVDAVVLSLLLSLRFMGLVFEEVRSLALGVVARGINWKQLRMLGSIDLVVSLAGRLFQNLFSHADQIAQAMVARGFQGDPSRHKLFLFTSSKGLSLADWLASVALVALCVSVWRSGLMLPA